MLTPEQSKKQDDYLSERHQRYADMSNKVMIDARELFGCIANMDWPEWIPCDGKQFSDMVRHIADLIDLVGTLDNPDLARGWLFSWQDEAKPGGIR